VIHFNVSETLDENRQRQKRLKTTCTEQCQQSQRECLSEPDDCWASSTIVSVVTFGHNVPITVHLQAEMFVMENEAIVL